MTQGTLDRRGIVGLEVLVETKVPAQLSEDIESELLHHTGCKLSGRHTANEKLRLVRDGYSLQDSVGQERSVCGEGPMCSEWTGDRSSLQRELPQFQSSKHSSPEKGRERKRQRIQLLVKVFHS